MNNPTEAGSMPPIVLIVAFTLTVCFGWLFSPQFCFAQNSDSISIVNQIEYSIRLTKEKKYEEALSVGHSCLMSSNRVANKYLIIRSQSNLGNIHRLTQSMDSAKYYVQEAFRMADRFNDKIGKVRTFHIMGLIEYAENNLNESKCYFDQALTVSAGKPEMKKEEGLILKSYAVVAKSEGDFLKSSQCCRNAIQIFKGGNDTLNLADTYNNYGLLFFQEGDYQNSLTQHQSAEVLYRSIKNLPGIAMSLNNIGNCYYAEDDILQAKTFWKEAFELRQLLGVDLDIAGASMNLGLAEMAEGCFDEALDHFIYSKEIYEKYKKSRKLSEVNTNIASVFDSAGNQPNAIHYYYEALKEARTSDFNHQLPVILVPLARYSAANGNWKFAYESVQEAMDILNKNQTSAQDARSYEIEYAFAQEKIATLKAEQTQKDAEIKSDQTDKRNLRTTIILLSIALILALLALLSVIFGRMQRARARIAEQESRLQKMQVEELEQKQQVLTLEGILQGKEMERDRIARDLHDRLGGHLSAVKLHLTEGAENKKANQLMDKAVEEVRRISSDLRSEVLTRFGLAAALEEYAATVNSAEKLKVKVIAHGMDQRPDATIETAVYYIALELLTNVIRHAKAGKVTVQLLRHGNHLNLLVEDDGVGFDPRLVKEKGMGLGNVKRRVEALGGTLSIDSTPGKGTTMSVDLAL